MMEFRNQVSGVSNQGSDSGQSPVCNQGLMPNASGLMPKASGLKPAGAPPSPRPLVLLADDEPDIALVTRTRIQLNGYDVIVAGDGEIALAMIRQALPDLILLDLKMPKLDGFQVCKIVKSDPALRHIPVLLFSASSSYALSLEKQCLQLGADGYVRKPFDVRELLDKIAALIAARPGFRNPDPESRTPNPGPRMLNCRPAESPA
jgi:two-component system, OmpR family, alkaline phosphatase synthesis response regulator PhoP